MKDEFNCPHKKDWQVVADKNACHVHIKTCPHLKGVHKKFLNKYKKFVIVIGFQLKVGSTITSERLASSDRQQFLPGVH